MVHSGAGLISAFLYTKTTLWVVTSEFALYPTSRPGQAPAQPLDHSSPNNQLV